VYYKGSISLVKIWTASNHKILHPPMHLLYIGNALKKAGYSIKIFHFNHKDVFKRITEIVDYASVFVGFSIITGDPADTILQIAKSIKRKKNIPVVFGGIHPTFEPEQCLKEDCVDFVVLHEGENTVVELADALSHGKAISKINGLGYKDSNKIIINPFIKFHNNLDDFEMDWSLVDVEKYIYPHYAGTNRVLMGYVASRGCPHNCGFCYNQIFWKRKWRRHSSDKVVNNINRLAKKYNFKGIVFFDDNFTVNKKWTFDILDNINVNGIHVETRIDYIDEDFLIKLTKRNVKSLFIGVESGSDRILKLLSKGFNTKDIYKALSLFKKYPIPAKLSFIVGIPSENLLEYSKTLNLIVWCIENVPNCGFTFGFYLPYPGTQLFQLCLEKGFEKPDSFIGWKKLDRWGNQDIEIPWTEDYTLKPLEVKKLIFLIGRMHDLTRCSKPTLLNKLLYKLVRCRFRNSGTKTMHAISYIEDFFLPLFRFFYKKTKSYKTKNK